MFLSIFLTFSAFSFVKEITNEVIEYYDEIPEFALSNGVLSVESPVYSKIDSNISIAIDTNYTFDEFVNTKEYVTASYTDVAIIINQDRLTTLREGMEYSYLPFQDLNLELTRDAVYEELLSFSDDKAKQIQTIFVLYVSIVVSYFMSLIFKVLFIACLVSIMCVTRGIRLNYANYVKIAIYEYTFPLIVEVIVACLVGPGKTYTYWASILLLYVYLLYAIRAVRLDAFLMMFSRKENVRHNNAEFESELEKYQEMNNIDNTKEEENEKEEDKKE